MTVRLAPIALFALLTPLLWKPTPALGLPQSDGAELQRELEQIEKHLLTHPGDPQRGELVFRNEKAKCSVCHLVDGQGGKVGPDLSSIGGKFDRPHLIESLIEPSAQIVEGYRTVRILTEDGQVVAGVVLREGKDFVEISDANAEVHRFASSEIAQRSVSGTSIMPAEIHRQISLGELTDLVAYLETLRAGGKHGAGSDIRGPITLPDGFTVTTIATGLSGGTALEVLPDGRVLVCEQIGRVRIVEDDQLLPNPLVELEVNSEWERGVIGVTVDPDFPAKPYLYVCWTGPKPYPHHRISRFEMRGNEVVPDSHMLLLKGDDQSKMGGNVPAGHQGGALHFGKDEKLYVAIGEQTAGQPSQRLDTFLGKMLRINRDGTIPDDNPLLNETRGKYQAIWAYGMRNPFTFAIRDDGLMLINDVGGNFEEINVGHPGRNYGWPTVPHGPANDAEAADGDFEDPIHWYPEASISGGDFLADDTNWPKEFQGRYFFADFKHGWIHSIDAADGEKSEDFATGLQRPVDLRFSPDGTLYVLLRNAWVIDGKFQEGTSSLLAIRPSREN